MKVSIIILLITIITIIITIISFINYLIKKWLFNSYTKNTPTIHKQRVQSATRGSLPPLKFLATSLVPTFI